MFTEETCAFSVQPTIDTMPGYHRIVRAATIMMVAVAAAFANIHAQSEPGDEVAAVRAILDAQQEAWNRGDYEGFMEGYWKSDSLTFASGNRVTRGWQTTLENYKVRYPDRAAMGRLTFTLYEIRVLSETDAFVFGRYELARQNDRPTGLFTLLFKKAGEQWRIVFDHTSTD
jgi:uncharacterized protein (TIGR02246 family)